MMYLRSIQITLRLHTTARRKTFGLYTMRNEESSLTHSVMLLMGHTLVETICIRFHLHLAALGSVAKLDNKFVGWK